jgi:hypothetical protein
MTRLFTFSRGLILAAALATAPTAAAAQTPTPITGAWEGTVTVNDVPIPFRYEIAGKAGTLNGVFFDGDRPLPSADARRAVSGPRGSRHRTAGSDRRGAVHRRRLRHPAAEPEGRKWRGA